MLKTCDVRHASHASRPVHLRTRWSPRFPPGTGRRLVREICLIATFALLYEEIRAHMVQAGAAAASHALLIVRAEQDLGIFHEQAVQAVFLRSDNVIDAFNAYYGGTHFLIPALVLAWLLLRHPAHYGRARTSLAVSTGLAFIVFWVFPVAPPRLLPAHFGIVDTLVTPDGSGHFDSVLLNSAGDQYASMPSLHVAWAVWCALALYPVLRHRALRALAVAYPLLTTLVVVATGNHFFLDAVAGAVLACLTWFAVTRTGAWLTVRRATWRARHGHGPLSPSGRPRRPDATTLRPCRGRLQPGTHEEREDVSARPLRGN
jgi:PAP2 superfamily